MGPNEPKNVKNNDRCPITVDVKVFKVIDFFYLVNLRPFSKPYFQFYLPWGFRKAGMVWCGGARETHWATCHNGVTPSKTKEFLKSPRFFRSSCKELLRIILKKLNFWKLNSVSTSFIYSMDTTIYPLLISYYIWSYNQRLNSTFQV